MWFNRFRGTMNKQYIFLLSIFLITVIPTIYLYLEHSNHERMAYLDSKEKNDSYKATKQLAESTFFLFVGIGYLVCSILIILAPEKRIPYLVILVGTVVVVIIYYLRINGIP